MPTNTSQEAQRVVAVHVCSMTTAIAAGAHTKQGQHRCRTDSREQVSMQLQGIHPPTKKQAKQNSLRSTQPSELEPQMHAWDHQGNYRCNRHTIGACRHQPTGVFMTPTA